MDPDSSLRKICIGEDVVVISSDKVEGSGDWNFLEFQDTANSGPTRETKAMVFYQMDTEEVSDISVAPCFVNGLEAYDGEINLGVEENIISREYAVKLCLEHEVKRGNKVVKKELIVALRGEIYFVKFIIIPKEDNVEPVVIFGRSFLRMTKAITDFKVGTITIYPKIDPFLEETENEEKSNDDWDCLLDFNIYDVPLLGEEGLSPFVCKMGKSSHNKKQAMENLNFFYQDIRTSSSARGEEGLSPFVCKIGKSSHNKKQAMENLNFFYQDIRTSSSAKGVTTLISKFLILDIPIDHDSPIVVGLGCMRTIGGIVNTPERLFSTFDGFYHQTFRAARSDVMRNTKSDSDDEEDYQIKRNKKPSLRVIHKMITYGLCQRMTRYDKIQKNDLWLLSMFDSRHQNGYANVAWVIARWIKRKGVGTQKESQICCGQFISKIARKRKVLTEDVVRILSAPIYYRDLDTITLRGLIDSDDKLILEDPQLVVPKGVFKHMAGVYSVPLQGACNQPGYAQPQYDQYYQQYLPPPPQYSPQYQQQQQDDE
nr:hypothetical protein [Tanacetum cinerariifolium]